MTRLSIVLAVAAAAAFAQQRWQILSLEAPWRQIGESLLIVLAATVFHALAGWFVAGLHEGRLAWQQRLRERLGLEPGEKMREAVWLKWSLALLVWGAAPVLILQRWGLGEVASDLVQRAVSAGIPVGNVQIVPAKVVLGILVIALTVTVVRVIAHRMETRWLASAGVDPSLRVTIATLFTYVSIAIAILFGLSVAGFDMSNLALVAGGLGVGIGFGLQNIVSNFVSGIILLFERPIRAGDYINIGGNEGYVRRIRVRATEIETLNHQHVVIPNSQFITEPVMNWSLHDPYVRVVIPVGVAYGSDTELVRRLLLEVAEEHELVLTGGFGGAPRPVVHFVSFGDSSLDFQLKCYIRHVEQRHQVISDLHFAIDRKFREHDVTIPFPQRDLWLKNPLQLVGAKDHGAKDASSQ